MTPTLGDRGWWTAYAVALVAVSAVCFASAVDLGLDTHDGQMFRNNEAVAQDWRHFFLPVEQKENPAGRPVAELAKVLGHLLWGRSAAAFHLFVVALHTLAAVLLVRVALALGHGHASAAAAGLVFLVNVAHFQAVYHISALDYPLALNFSWAALLAWLRWLDTRRAGWLAGFSAALLVAVMSHLSSASVLVLCLWLVRERRADRLVVRHLAVLGAAALALGAVLVAITSRDTSTWRSFELYGETGAVELVAGCAKMLLWFLGRLVTTAHWLPLDFSRLHRWELGVGVVVLAGLAALVRARHLPGATWAVWVVASLLPFALLTEATILEMPAGPSRYLYPASAGTSALLVLGAGAGLRRLPRHRTVGGGVLLAVLVLVSGGALYRAQGLFFYTSGRYHMSIGDEDTAAAQLRRAIDRGGGSIPLLDAYLRLANILMARGDATRDLVDEARARIPGEPVLDVLAAVHDADGGGDMAATARALTRIDDLVVRQERLGAEASAYDLRAMAGLFFWNLGLAQLRAEDHAGAVAPLTHALRYDPSRRRAAEGLAYALFRTGRCREAGLLWERLDDPGNAAAAFREALAADPGDDEARRHLEALTR